MVLVRILVGDEYDHNVGRFKSYAFLPSSEDGEISCFERDCAVRTSGGPCRHIRQFYPAKVPPNDGPVYYWVFDTNDIPAPPKAAPKIEILQSRGDTGDECHHGVKNVAETAARNFFKKGHYTIRIRAGFETSIAVMATRLSR